MPRPPLPPLAALAATVLVAATACRVHEPRDFATPPVAIPGDYAAADGLLAEVSEVERAGAESDPDDAPEPWWRTFGDSRLDAAVESALAGNLDLRQAWSRLRQAAAEVVIAGAAREPALDATGSASITRLGDRDPEVPPDGTPGNRWDERYALGLALSWEVDLWGRLASRAEAARLRAEATRADVSDAALLVAAGVVEAWFDVQQERALLELLEEQLETSRTLLDLTELRFSLGEGSSVAVLQQRQQVAATESQLPAARGRLAAARHRLAVLLGRPPGDLGPLEPDGALPELPPLPPLAAPGELLVRRPDVRAAFTRLDAADRDVAEAVADRLPRLSLGLSYDWTTGALGAAFQRDVATIAASALAPLLDGGRREAEVDRRQALLQSRLDEVGAVVLVALREVEDALARERHQRELLRRRATQLAFARATLDETRSRYANGLGDYLDVIVAVQSLQELERRILGEQAELLTNRARLHRALGGRWMEQLAPPAPHEVDAFTAAAADATAADAADGATISPPSGGPPPAAHARRPETRE